MTATDAIRNAEAELHAAFSAINSEIRAYPGPISGCDAQYNYLLGMRGAVRQALSALAEPHFVPTPRQPDAAAAIEQR